MHLGNIKANEATALLEKALQLDNLAGSPMAGCMAQPKAGGSVTYV